MEIQPRLYARYSFVNTFLEIAVKNYLQSLEFEKELEVVKGKGTFEHEGAHIYNDIEGYFLQSSGVISAKIECVIFLAIFLESYIYELGAIALGDKYVINNLDNLRVYAKWIVTVKLITGHDFDQSLAHHGKFKELIKLRNDLIHYKSQNALLADQQYTSPKLDFERIDLYDYFVMLRDLFKELDRLDPNQFHGQKVSKSLEKILVHSR